MSSFHLRFVGAGEQAGTANECGVCGEVTNGRVLRCQQAGFTLDSNRCDLHRNRDHPYIDDGDLPADNNWVENQIRPIALGRNNWLFAGSLRSGKRAAAIMSLIHSARLNGHEPHAYLKGVMERLPTQQASRIGELLPHRWKVSS